MKTKCLMALFALMLASVSVFAQSSTAAPPEAGVNMAYDIARIAESVQSMTKTLRDFVDKFAKVEGLTLAEKQQKLIVGMELLIRAEQRVATLQKFQVELVEKDGQLRSRLAQVENDLNPQGLDRSVALEGSTQTPEIKENRRRALAAERTSLQTLLQQMQSQLQTAGSDVRDAQYLVVRLRRTYLPQVERELADQ